MTSAKAVPSRPVVGRLRELARVRQLVERVPAQGGGLIVRGDPGIGKTALLDFTSDTARGLELRLLSVYGAPQVGNAVCRSPACTGWSDRSLLG